MAPLLPTDSSPQTEPDSPFGSEPEPPRLGISHLLVWVMLVAILFSVYRSCGIGESEFRSPRYVFFACIHGAAQAAAIGGLLLLAARRYRGLAFPRYAGETLLVLLGTQALLQHITLLFLRVPVAYVVVTYGPSWFTLLIGGWTLLGFLVQAGVYFWAIRRTNVRRWRVYLLIRLGTTIILPSMWLLFLPMSVLLPYLAYLPALVLVWVAAVDARQDPRYPWTHWLGVGIVIVGNAASVIGQLLTPIP